ncbi:MAG: hypothetical protein CM15mP23_08710 [Cryomorphaceae bacterium]|nr:MAG: hypothetical protein CM15mP23_08710 [Cryomorphaceae bacterium]
MVAENLEDRYEALLELEPFVVSGDSPTLSFWHKYITEPAFDGGYISISTDESNFEDLGPHIIRGHYRGFLKVLLRLVVRILIGEIVMGSSTLL